MKKLLCIFFFLLNCWTHCAQNLQLKITSDSKQEQSTIDSVGYINKHQDLKSIKNEVNLFSEKLIRLGYIESQIIGLERQNDTVFLTSLQLGKKIPFINLYISTNTKQKLSGIIDLNKDTLTVAISKTSTYLKQLLAQLESKGFSLSKIKLNHFIINNDTLIAEIIIDLGQKRLLNDFVINGYDKFPEGHKANLRRTYKNKTFNQENLKKIYNDFEQFRFVSQTKYPEILFTKDTTKVYVYLEKSKPNKFEGFIGFSNDDESNVRLNGYLDLLLVNALNSGEALTLYWKSDGDDQKTLNIAMELPYIFKSRLGLKANLNIFKQDSTFQNTKTAIDLGFYFAYNTRLFVGYQSTESSDIQNQNNFSISDYKNSFLTSNFEFLNFHSNDFLFPEKTRVNFKMGLGSRISKTENNSQYFFDINLKHTIYLNKKNSFNLKSQNYYLKSDSYITNELYRFGGINSIRGFNENSLQANIFTSLITEYRYVIAPNLYVHNIVDYGYYKDTTTKKEANLLGIGLGFGLLTKNGLLNIVYANGKTENQEIKLANAIVHLSFKTNF